MTMTNIVNFFLRVRDMTFLKLVIDWKRVAISLFRRVSVYCQLKTYHIPNTQKKINKFIDDLLYIKTILSANMFIK